MSTVNHLPTRAAASLGWWRTMSNDWRAHD
ncbi:hypothetical protein FHS50_001831 [Sphingomicrobium lutaoense]|uniref:Uncharacterized protein n=1 Tax=Sphingomicrobium lutaoense TaxID=515949 RepID=A0A839Z082_9SPHN|nr:hypothetical protein [Sphingomicrobium lutaoense]